MSSERPSDIKGLRRAFSYPRSPEGAISVLGEILHQKIAAEGPISFKNYMTECLYHPEYGYYSRPQETIVSKSGDFITSVSVGPVFGKLLTHRLHDFWQANDSPEKFVITEVGAHDGTLARDILSEIKNIGGAFAAAASYRIIEPLAHQQTCLHERLGREVEILAAPTPCDFGAIIANEVLDALPVPLLLYSEQRWLEVMVTSENQQLAWETRPAKDFPEGNFAEGYVTEGPPDLSKFLEPLAETMQDGLLVFIDYGLDADSLYHPDRTAGTLRCYRRQSNKTHPLDFPGEQDLTADVNFTAVENAATALGLATCRVIDQGRYLTHCAKKWLLTSHPSPAEIRQFQTLIHPSQFGTRFYALELIKGKATRGFPA